MLHLASSPQHLLVGLVALLEWLNVMAQVPRSPPVVANLTTGKGEVSCVADMPSVVTVSNIPGHKLDFHALESLALMFSTSSTEAKLIPTTKYVPL